MAGDRRAGYERREVLLISLQRRVPAGVCAVMYTGYEDIPSVISFDSC